MASRRWLKGTTCGGHDSTESGAAGLECNRLILKLMSVHDPYAEERAFLATLPGWRRFLSRLNWRSPLNDYHPSQDSRHPKKLSARNAVKATLLLMLGAGVLVFLVWSRYLLIVLFLIPIVLAGAALISALWRAIYDTLQEGESSQMK